MKRLAHNIGPSKINENYNTPVQVMSCTEPLTFDGVYKNVHDYRELLLGKDVTLFVTGDYVGKDNSFDTPMPLEKFCDWSEIMDLVVNYKCKLGWHTWSHKDLTTLPYDKIVKEVTPPFPMETFAYPYGRFNADCVRAVKEAGFKKAYSVTQGNENEFTLFRNYL